MTDRTIVSAAELWISMFIVTHLALGLVCFVAGVYFGRKSMDTET